MDQQKQTTMAPQTAIAKTSPQDFLMNVLAMIALYVSTFNLIRLLIEYINKAFPDPLRYGDPADAIRWPIAILVILWPVYLWVTRFLHRDRQAHPEKTELRIRKWLVYLTLFLSARALIGDLVTLVYNLLQGDFTTPFLLKVMMVLVVGAVIFSYYLSDLRRGANAFSPRARILNWVAVVAVSVTIVSGFAVAGSPFRQRQ